MPPIVLAAGIAAAGAVGGAAISSRAAGKATKAQTTAATEAARLEDDAAKRAEAFQRQQAQQQWAEAESVRRANYDQWASRQRALNAFRAKHGYGATEIPGYTPSQDPGYTTAPAGPAPMPGAPGPGGGGVAVPRMPPGGPRDTSDPTRFWPIDPETGLKRPPRPGEAGPLIMGPDVGSVDDYVRGRPRLPYQPSQRTAYQQLRRPTDDRVMSVGGYLR